MCIKGTQHIGVKAALRFYRKDAFLQQRENVVFADAITNYLSQLGAGYKRASRKAAGAVAMYINSVGRGIPLEDLQRGSLDVVFKTLLPEWNSFTQQKVAGLIEANYMKIFNEDSLGIFGDKANLIPARTFSVRDENAISYFADQNRFFLGNIIEGNDAKNDVFDTIRKVYLDEGFEIGNLRKTHLNEIRGLVGASLDTQDWKITRVVNTTVNRMRSISATHALQDAGITRYQIIGIGDERQCPYCRALQGKEFEVVHAQTTISNFLSAESHETVSGASPFITSKQLNLTPDAVGKATGAELAAAGVTIPPFHPFCRDRVIAVFDNNDNVPVAQTLIAPQEPVPFDGAPNEKGVTTRRRKEKDPSKVKKSYASTDEVTDKAYKIDRAKFREVIDEDSWNEYIRRYKEYELDAHELPRGVFFAIERGDFDSQDSFIDKLETYLRRQQTDKAFLLEFNESEGPLFAIDQIFENWLGNSSRTKDADEDTFIKRLFLASVRSMRTPDKVVYRGIRLSAEDRNYVQYFKDMQKTKNPIKYGKDMELFDAIESNKEIKRDMRIESASSDLGVARGFTDNDFYRQALSGKKDKASDISIIFEITNEKGVVGIKSPNWARQRETIIGNEFSYRVDSIEEIKSSKFNSYGQEIEGDATRTHIRVTQL